MANGGSQGLSSERSVQGRVTAAHTPAGPVKRCPCVPKQEFHSGGPGALVSELENSFGLHLYMKTPGKSGILFHKAYSPVLAFPASRGLFDL